MIAYFARRIAFAVWAAPGGRDRGSCPDGAASRAGGVVSGTARKPFGARLLQAALLVAVFGLLWLATWGAPEPAS